MSAEQDARGSIDWAKYVIRNCIEDEYQVAFNIFSAHAESESTDAMFCIGLMYARGQGVPKGYKDAFYWIEKAYKGGHKDATYFLGKMYLNGLGTEVIIHKAESLFKEAARWNDSRAEMELGLLYFREERMKDYAKSAKWFQRAAIRSNPEAQFILGQLYKAGVGVDKNIVEAVVWLKTAAIGGHKGAQILLGNMYRIGDGVTVNRDESDRWYDMADGKIYDGSNVRK